MTDETTDTTTDAAERASDAPSDAAGAADTAGPGDASTSDRDLAPEDVTAEQPVAPLDAVESVDDLSAGDDDDVAEIEADPELRAAADGRSPGELLVELEDAQRLRDEYLDALQRSRAEFDNYRRRTAREAASARAAGAGDLVTSLLDVLDDLDRTAEVAAGSADEGLAAGIRAVHRKLVDALMAAGVRRIDEEGVPFDATRHEAVQQVPAEQDVDEPEVAQVLRPGYVHNDRVLRAAMVVVRQ